MLLDYFYYSTIQHAIRKMPIVSAINVEGNVADRKDSSKRVDHWLQDNRIDPDTQLRMPIMQKADLTRDI